MTASPIDRLLPAEAATLTLEAGELLTVDVWSDPSGPGVVVVGEVDSATAAVLRAGLDAALDGAEREVVIDLRAVTFLESTGLGVLLDAHHRALAQGIGIRLLVATRAVVRPLQLTGMWDLLGAERVDAEVSPPR